MTPEKVSGSAVPLILMLPNMGGMKRLFIVLLAVPLAAAAQSVPDAPQPASPAWIKVQSLGRGERIIVTAINGQKAYCDFAGATNDTLFCDPSLWSGRGELEVAHTRIAEIRHNDKLRNFHIAIAGGAAVGAIVGAATAPGHDNADAQIGYGLAGGLVGFVGGCLLAGPVTFLPGRLIYRTQKSKSRARTALQKFTPNAPAP